MLNWIIWNRTVLHLTVCKQKTIVILNWIVWNFYQNDLIRRKMTQKVWYAVKQNNQPTNPYIGQIELFNHLTGQENG